MVYINLITELLTAVGTIGATLVALFLALRDNSPRVNGVFAWGAETDDKPTLLVQNTGTKIAVIESVTAFYNKEQICAICFSNEESLKNFTIIMPGEVKQIPLDTDWLHISEPSNKEKPYTMKLIIKPIKGCKNVSKQKYSFNELKVRLFAAYFASNDE